MTPVVKVDQLKPMESIENDHNVYILGAGFSVDAGLPVIKDFLLRMRDSHPWLVENHRQREADAVRKVLEFRLKAASAAYWVTLDLENIEELFSLASASTGALNEDIMLAVAATIDFAVTTAARAAKEFEIDTQNLPIAGKCSWLPPSPARTGLTPPTNRVWCMLKLYSYYVAKMLGMFSTGQVRGRNTFISFNYDTVLESALMDLKVPFLYGGKLSDWQYDASLGLDEALTPLVEVLKLHGSVNWAQSTDRNDSRLLVYGSYEALRQKNLIPVLIPPTWKKSFQSPLDRVWDSAVHQLQRAPRVIIVGFSCPSTDVHFKYLLAAGLQENVSLRQMLFVNPSANELRERAKRMVREAYIKPAEAPEQDVGRIQFEPESLNSFLAGTRWIDRIGRPYPLNAAIHF